MVLLIWSQQLSVCSAVLTCISFGLPPSSLCHPAVTLIFFVVVGLLRRGPLAMGWIAASSSTACPYSVAKNYILCHCDLKNSPVVSSIARNIKFKVSKYVGVCIYIKYYCLNIFLWVWLLRHTLITYFEKLKNMSKLLFIYFFIKRFLKMIY